jgi:hypothetical protein
MTPAEVLAQARAWLDANHPVAGGWTDSSDATVAVMVDLNYPTGMRGFIEDLLQSTAVS